jgi:hypothetical protein
MPQSAILPFETVQLSENFGSQPTTNHANPQARASSEHSQMPAYCSEDEDGEGELDLDVHVGEADTNPSQVLTNHGIYGADHSIPSLIA